MTDIEILSGGRIKKNDTEPALRVKCYNSLGNPFNLDGYTVSLKLRRSDSDTNKVDASATVATAGKGIVSYDWAVGDTDVEGTFVGEVVADDGSGSVVTFPNEGFFHIYIEEGL